MRKKQVFRLKDLSFKEIKQEFKTSMLLSIPMIATEIIYSLAGFIATVFVAHLGKEQLAANALFWGIYITLIVLFIGVLSSVSIMVAHSFGANDKKGISVCFKQGLILSIICSIPMMLIMWLSPVVLEWTGQDPQIIALAKPLFYVFFWCMLPINFSFVMEQFLIGITKTHIVTIIVSLSVPIQILFYYMFIFGKLGLPAFGLEGIGYANLVEHVLITIFFTIYLYYAKDIKQYNIFHKWWRINKKFIKEMFRVGLPLGAMFAIEVSLFASIAILMGKFGTDTLASYQISYQYMMIPIVILFAIAQGTSVRVGNEVGRLHRPTIALTTYVNLCIGCVCMLLFTILYIVFPLQAISLDLNIHDPKLHNVVILAKQFLIFVSILIVSDNLRIVSFGALRSLKDTKFTMLNSLVCFWGIAFVASYVLGFKYNMQGIGVWIGVIVGLFANGLMMLLRFNSLYKKIDLHSLVTRS